MSDFLKVLNERTSAEHFDSATPISVQEIKELISEACQAPSSFHIQHWRFIAVTDERIRERLKGTTIASNQERYRPTTALIFPPKPDGVQLAKARRPPGLKTRAISGL